MNNENKEELEKAIPNNNSESKESNIDDNVTREINLDDLYDGVVNNTVVIDPITNNEVLVPDKKHNHTVIGVIFAVLILLILYYVTTKTDLGRTNKDLESKTTTKPTTVTIIQNQTLTCTYQSKSDSETGSVTYIANGVGDEVTASDFIYSVVLATDTSSAVEDDLAKQYENLYISNVAVNGINTSYDKTDKGFTFESKTDYKKAAFDVFTVTDGQAVLYYKPSKTDTLTSLKETYTSKGYTCTIAVVHE